MTSKSVVENFLAQKSLAVVGVSRSGWKFGNSIYKALKSKGYHVFAINPNANKIKGEPCYRNLSAVPDSLDGVILNVKPAESEKVLHDVVKSGISRVWLQQGAESDAAIQFCEQNNIQVVHHECILMFAEPVGLGHRFHRWIWGLLGKLPE